ncbi:MAG: hypothetical protein NVV62_08740 [Terricaulis sp.]|nr:hypothetical protein [Terricaulis sp.]
MDGESDRAVASRADWLVSIALIAGAVGLGWLLSKTGFYEASPRASGPVLVVMLAAAALYIFSLPFWKYMPRLPLSERVRHAAITVFNFTLLAWSSSTMFSQGAVTMGHYVGFGVAVVLLIFLVRLSRFDDGK